MSKKTHRQFDIVFCVLLIVLAIVFALSRSIPETTVVPIVSGELTQLLAGNTLTGTGYAFHFAADGTIRGVVQGFPDTGVWSVVDDQACIQWKVWGHGKQHCWLLARSGADIEMTNLARANSIAVTWHAGNSRNL